MKNPFRNLFKNKNKYRIVEEYYKGIRMHSVWKGLHYIGITSSGIDMAHKIIDEDKKEKTPPVTVYEEE